MPQLLTTPDSVAASTATGSDDFTPTCVGQAANDHVYTWTAPSSDYYDFTVKSGSFNPVLTLYGEDCGAEVECEADGRYTGFISSGTSYTVVVDGDGAGGGYTLDVDRLGCPEQKVGNTLPAALDVDTSSDAYDRVETQCGQSGWVERSYEFTAQSAGVYDFFAVGDVAHAMSLRDGSTCADEEISCIPSSSTLGTSMARPMMAGESVTLILEGPSGFAADLGVATTTCLDADITGLGAPLVSGSQGTWGASTMGASCVNFEYNAGRVFTYTAISSGNYTFSLEHTVEAALAIYDEGSCGGSEISCAVNDPGTSPAVLGPIALSADQEITLVVVGTNITPGFVPLELSVTTTL